MFVPLRTTGNYRTAGDVDSAHNIFRIAYECDARRPVCGVSRETVTEVVALSVVQDINSGNNGSYFSGVVNAITVSVGIIKSSSRWVMKS